MPDVKRTRTLGLNTDLPPDRLEERAFDVRNMLPRSPETSGPRDGVSLIDHYTSASNGRQIIIDDLPFRSDKKQLIVCVNTEDSGGSPLSRTDGLLVYEPKVLTGGRLSPESQGQTGAPWSVGGSSAIGTRVFGMVI